jgi:5'-nucleotidase
VTRKRILISNDDGVDAPGIAALKKALEPLGEVTVVAPDREQSASSHALTLKHPLRVTEVGERVFAVDGTPSDAVHLAINGFFNGEKFDMVASGINAGANMGDDITYSGTVSAAMEATLLGVPAFAVSLDARKDYLWESAGHYAQKLGAYILETGLAQGVLLNLNVPNLPLDQIKPLLMTHQGKRIYGDSVVEKKDPRGERYYWIGGQKLGFEPIPGSDLQAVHDQHVSITPVHMDLTEYKQLALLAGLKL